VYRVRATAGALYLPPNNLAGSPAVADLANLATYGSLAGATIRAQHIIELRQAVNALADTLGLTRPYSAIDVTLSTLQGVAVRAADLTSLLAQINALRTDPALGMGAAQLTETPAPNVRIRRQHLEELRNSLN
jgi:hypothetical protein